MCIEKENPRLSVRRQCKLLSLSRSGLYCTPKGESAENLRFMEIVDKQFLDVSRNCAAPLIVSAGGILHPVIGGIVLSQIGCLACPARLFVLTEGGIEARGFIRARSSRCSFWRHEPSGSGAYF